MAVEVINLKRKFVLDDETLEDPNPQFSVDEVMGFYSVKYPELTTATVTGPEVKGEQAIYEFKTTVGTKG